MFEDAKSGALRTIDALEKTGAVKHAEDCRVLLHKIEEASSRKVDSDGELLKTAPLLAPVDSPFSA